MSVYDYLTLIIPRGDKNKRVISMLEGELETCKSDEGMNLIAMMIGFLGMNPPLEPNGLVLIANKKKGLKVIHPTHNVNTSLFIFDDRPHLIDLIQEMLNEYSAEVQDD